MKPGRSQTDGYGRPLEMGVRSFLAASCLFVSTVLAQTNDDKSIDIQAVLAGKIDPATLNPEQRPQCEAELRALAASENEGIRRRASTVLLNLGDTQTVHALLQAIDSRHAHVRDDAERISLACRNPDVIPSFVDLLLLNEEPGVVVLDSEFIRPPRSVTAAGIIRQIVISSPQFPPGTRDWARSLNGNNSGAFREAMRRWWAENRQFIEKGEYAKVAPPPVEKEGAGSGPRDRK